jgi:uncharacterized repeat protein (TIGR01451 family)
VWDPETAEWVKELTANVSDILTFRCEVRNNDTIHNLTNITVGDFLSPSLKFQGYATVHYPNCTTKPKLPDYYHYDFENGTDMEWRFNDLVLKPFESITIEFDALILKCGVAENDQFADAWCEGTGEEVIDVDIVNVIVPCLCIAGIEVNKTVWNGTAWVDAINADAGDILRFRCEIHNNGTCSDLACCNLTEIVVWDLLSSSLEYKDNATVHYPDCTTIPEEPYDYYYDPETGETSLMWMFWYLVLEPCESITIEFDARVKKCGIDENNMYVGAWCEETGDWVEDEDMVNVTAPCLCIAEIEVNKAVWNGTAWVDTIDGNVGDMLTFRCEIHNNGTCSDLACCNLTDIAVRDSLSDSLEYSDNATVHYPNCTTISKEPDYYYSEPGYGTDLRWYFNDLVLEPCESITIAFDARVARCGNDSNEQYADARCVETDEWVDDWDKVRINVGVPGLEVTKSVWDVDTGEWVDTINANINDVVRFRCEIHNNRTCNLTDIRVEDYISNSMEYADNATVHYPNGSIIPREPEEWQGIYVWEFTGLVLEPCQTLTIEFEADAVRCGYGWNRQYAEGVEEEPGETFFGVDEVGIRIGTGIEVNKSVWDPNTGVWVDTIMAKVGDTMTFRGEIHNNCTCNQTVTDIRVEDYLSNSLEYADNATVHYPNGTVIPKEPEELPGMEYVWEFGGFVLEPCQTLTIEFEVNAVRCGYGFNDLFADGIGDEPGEIFFDDDDVLVLISCIELNKTIWDADTGEWVGEITANVNDTLRFRCELHNNYTLNLGHINVDDILSDSLNYSNNATVQYPNGTTVPLEPDYYDYDNETGETYLWWEFWDLVLEPCESITIEFDARVVKCGIDENVQSASALCMETAEFFVDEDRVYVTVPCIIKKADLVITGKWLCWPDNCTICYNVTNIGNGTAPACHNTTLYVDSVAVAHDHVPVNLAPNASYLGCFDNYSWTYTSPSDNITVCADNNETIDELDETNNCLANIWTCGDVNCDGRVTMSDVRKVFNRYLDPNYPLDIPWAADVNCDGKVTMSDVRKVFNRYLDPGYEIHCCCEA